MKKIIAILCFSFGFSIAGFSEHLTYNNLYLSYVSANAARSIGYFIIEQYLGGAFIWELRGDSGFNEKSSLLKTISTVLSDNSTEQNKPLIIGYWGNWNVYSKEPDRAIPETPYGIPGSRDINGNTVINQDFANKLQGLNMVVYSHLQAQTQSYTYYDKNADAMVNINNKTPELIGTLYFSDPWVDLATSGVSATQDAFCRKNSALCDFTLTNRTTPIELKDGAKMGNFDAFTLLKHTKDTSFAPLRKIISIGGFGHEASFEDLFNAPAGMDNFVNSAKKLLDAYQLDGIELDYENPRMTHENAVHFVKLVKQLKTAMPNKLLLVTALSDPSYLQGIYEGGYGYPEGTLSEMAQYAKYIILLTHDVNGAFNHPPLHNNTTGFLTNLTLPSKSTVPLRFSTENTVRTAIKVGIPSSQLIIGIPAYGRALAGISSENGGLFNPISPSTIIPRGDLDTLHCRARISPFKANNCSGAFQYHYILRKMLPEGVVESDYLDNDRVIGTTAYATSWSPPASTDYQLKISNQGGVGDLTFNVTIGDFVAPDFFYLNTRKIYDAQTTASINGKQALTVKWSNSSGAKGQCASKFDFTQNMHILIKAIPNDKHEGYSTFCTFVPLEG